jgi:hypothetical protein
MAIRWFLLALGMTTATQQFKSFLARFEGSQTKRVREAFLASEKVEACIWKKFSSSCEAPVVAGSLLPKEIRTMN